MEEWEGEGPPSIPKSIRVDAQEYPWLSPFVIIELGYFWNLTTEIL